MKIGINSRIYQNKNTGIPYFIKSLYSEITAKDKKNSYIFFQTEINKKIGETKVLRIPKFKGIEVILFDNFLIRKLIKSEKVDILHGPAHILPFFKSRNVKYILTVHDLAFLRFPEQNKGLFNIYYKFAVRRSVKDADIITAVSNNTKKDILKFFNVSKKKIKVIYPGINNIFFTVERYPRIIQEKYFFSITTHPRRKNILAVLQAISKNTYLQKFRYVIAGLMEENQIKELKAKIEEYMIKDNIVLFGYASERELLSLYQNAEFFVYPSFYEGFGFPVIEAMACGCPVLASNNSSLKEINKNSKYQVNANSISDISSKMENMLKLSTKKRNQLIKSNYEFSQNFSWDKTAEEYMKLFNNLINT